MNCRRTRLASGEREPHPIAVGGGVVADSEVAVGDALEGVVDDDLRGLAAVVVQCDVATPTVGARNEHLGGSAFHVDVGVAEVHGAFGVGPEDGAALQAQR